MLQSTNNIPSHHTYATRPENNECARRLSEMSQYLLDIIGRLFFQLVQVCGQSVDVHVLTEFILLQLLHRLLCLVCCSSSNLNLCLHLLVVQVNLPKSVLQTIQFRLVFQHLLVMVGDNCLLLAIVRLQGAINKQRTRGLNNVTF